MGALGALDIASKLCRAVNPGSTGSGYQHGYRHQKPQIAIACKGYMCPPLLGLAQPEAWGLATCQQLKCPGTASRRHEQGLSPRSLGCMAAPVVNVSGTWVPSSAQFRPEPRGPGSKLTAIL